MKWIYEQAIELARTNLFMVFMKVVYEWSEKLCHFVPICENDTQHSTVTVDTTVRNHLWALCLADTSV